MTNTWKIQPHTKAKHQILQAYLEQWFPIMVSNNPQPQLLIYIDGFAGPGVYENGEPGSPIVALNTILGHKSFQDYVGQMLFVFAEKDGRSFESLAIEIRRLEQSIIEFPKNVKVAPKNDEFANIVNQLQEKSQIGMPTLAFVDPFGFSGVNLEQLVALLQFPKCELILNFMVESVVRFRSHSNDRNQKAFLDLFGGDEYLTEFTSGETSDNLVNVFTGKLATLGGFKFVRTFKMVNSRGKAGNFIVFATRHPRGLEAMKAAMWKVDPQHGIRFSDIPDDPLFAGVPDFRGLKESVVEKFQGKSFTVADVEQFAVENTDFLRSHVRKGALNVLLDEGLLQVKEIKRKYTYPKDSVMTITPTSGY